MSSRLKALIIRVVLAGACALAATTTVASTAGPATAEAAAASDAAPARSLVLGGNDPIGVAIDTIVLNVLTS